MQFKNTTNTINKSSTLVRMSLITLSTTTLMFSSAFAAEKTTSTTAKTSTASTTGEKSLPEGKFSIDAMHSKIGFEVPHLVISSVDGKFEKYEGTITIDKAIEKSKVDFSIDVNSINTSVAKRDAHLKDSDFFDTKKFPKITFTSTKVSRSGNNLTVEGDLKIKDQTKKVTLDTKFLGEVKDGYGQNKIAFKATTKINRQEFNLKWSNSVEAGPVVGDEIEITLNIQAAKAK